MMFAHVLRTEEGTNPGFDAPVLPQPKAWFLRDYVLFAAELPRIAIGFMVLDRLEMLCIIVRYVARTWSRSRRTPMENMDDLIRLWVDSIAGLCTEHKPEKHDRADFRTDDMMTPILGAPTPEIREFATKLADALEADERIPYLVWRPYCEMIRAALTRATPDEVIQLKTGLAREIAVAVEKQVQPDLLDAIANALKWRSPETLKKVDTAVKSGEKAKLTGRQSCLYLQVGDELVML